MALDRDPKRSLLAEAGIGVAYRPRQAPGRTLETEDAAVACEPVDLEACVTERLERDTHPELLYQCAQIRRGEVARRSAIESPALVVVAGEVDTEAHGTLR